MLIFFLLMFVALSISVLGLKYAETLFIAAGAIWALVTAFAFRSRIPRKALAGTLVGMLVGVALGAAIGLVIAGVAEFLAGVVSGALFGALVGAVLMAGILGSLGLKIPMLSGIGVGVRLTPPRRITNVLLISGLIAGGVVGAVALREIIVQVYGPVGGSALAVGSLGAAVGLILGYRLTAVPGPGLPEKDPAASSESRGSAEDH
jgi:hypothetical protein